MSVVRSSLGTFLRTRQVWTPDSWDDGYTDNRGYFRVYRPDYPKAWADGYAKRYAVVYWLHTKHVPTEYEDLHHKNEVRTDDRFENLELLSHVDHAKEHRPTRATYICLGCGTQNEVPRGKTRATRRFCSQVCYHSSPRKAEHKENIRKGLQLAWKEGRR